jgi:hypothetical protein
MLSPASSTYLDLDVVRPGELMVRLAAGERRIPDAGSFDAFTGGGVPG